MNIEISPKKYERILDWHDGKLYCDLLTIDGKTDWRMPTLEELKEICFSGNSIDFNGSHYWSSTEYRDNRAWFQRMNGHQDYGFQIAIGYVRAVRSILKPS